MRRFPITSSTSACTFYQRFFCFSSCGASRCLARNSRWRFSRCIPVQVQSVAWISELKNTLSGVLFLLSALVYVRFDADRRVRDYAASLALFVAALLTKSVTAVLPGALLVVFWWRRGRLEWRSDIAPTLPFFALGASAGLFTAWVERTYIGAQGAEFHLSPIERVLIAGRAMWFYLGTLFWPGGLNFEYPRWSIDPSAACQYVYPVGALALLAVCWLLRQRSRAPLAAVLLFAGILFPALGFLNVYPFEYSFVADHFQYLATIPIMALVLRRCGRGPGSLGAAAITGLRSGSAQHWSRCSPPSRGTRVTTTPMR